MDAETYPDAEVAKAVNDHLVAVRVEAAKNPDLRKALKARASPTVVLVDGQRYVWHQFVGVRSPKEFLEELKKPDVEKRKFAEAQAAAEASPKDPMKLFDYGMALAKCARTRQALTTFVQVLVVDPEDKAGKADDIQLFMVIVQIDDEKWDEAEKAAAGFLATFEKSDLAPRAYLLLGWAQHRQGHEDDALASWGRGMELFPEAAEAKAMKVQADALRSERARAGHK